MPARTEAINTLVVIMNNEKAPPAARVAAANALLDRGYSKPTQPISQTLAKIYPSTMSDEELAAIVRGGKQPDVRPNKFKRTTGDWPPAVSTTQFSF